MTTPRLHEVPTDRSPGRPSHIPGDSPSISCEVRSYTYPDGTVANRNIFVRAWPGECLCFLGPNGAGKTTLVRQLTMELEPTDAKISLLGYDTRTHRSRAARSLGVIPQSAALFGELTAGSHLYHFARIKGLSSKIARAEVIRTIDRCGLGELRDRRVHTLSGGQQRQLLVALALLTDPSVLVFDEPTTGLDPVARRDFWRSVKEQKDAGKTIVLTTHDMEEAERLADRLTIVERGRAVYSGTLQDLLDQTGKPFRVTRRDPEGGGDEIHQFFDTLDGAVRYTTEQKLEEYTLGRVTLEQVYLRLMGADERS